MRMVQAPGYGGLFPGPELTKAGSPGWGRNSPHQAGRHQSPEGVLPPLRHLFVFSSLGSCFQTQLPSHLFLPLPQASGLRPVG